MERVLRILMLEDIAEEAGLIERVLKKAKLPFVSMRVDGPEEFVSALDAFTPDVVLSDHALPQFNSIEALKLCRARGLMIPFILVTGTVSEEFAVNCLKQGVDDYILKNNLSRLPAAILNSLNQREMESRRLVTELKLRDQNEELIKTNDLLRKINMELDNFVYSVSHNLRAPLMSVLGLVTIARMEDKKTTTTDEPDNKLFNMIEHSIHRLDDTLKEILDYSRNARTETSIAEVQLEPLFKDTLERLQYLKGFDRIDKEIRIVGDAPIYSDAYRLGIIFQNLISNSIKYQDVEKSRSYIRIIADISAEDIRIQFSDNGMGIREEYLPKIFSMFFRATERSEGAGLGLYIVKESVTKLGGDISLDSTFNEGSTFSIRIPNNAPSGQIKSPVAVLQG
ncbi:MAG TPA: ATP-binding protein [Cyclobacteriaceae bacterium]|nr:ATP-binding protein [Cyclobacteriaceae bacterium]